MRARWSGRMLSAHSQRSSRIEFWTDLRRGWRYTNPSLSVLKLIDVAFVGLDDVAEDAGQFTAILPNLGELDVAARRAMLQKLLGAMLEGLAVNTEALDLTVLDSVAQKSRNLLRVPWAIDAKETPRSRTTLILQAPSKDVVGLREEQTIIRAGHNSRVGRLINRKSVLGAKLGKADYLTVMTGLMDILAREGLVTPIDVDDDLRGWRLSPSAVRLVPGEAVREGARKRNVYFHDLYNAIAADLKSGRSSYWGLEGREHTAQVSQRQREWREWRFRFEEDDRRESCRERGRSQGDRRVRAIPARPVLLADDGARRRHLRAECRLPAKRASYPGELCSARGSCRSLRTGGRHRHLLRRPIPP